MFPIYQNLRVLIFSPRCVIKLSLYLNLFIEIISIIAKILDKKETIIFKKAKCKENITFLMIKLDYRKN